MNKLPKIQELYGDINMVQDQNDLNILLNQEPANEWVKLHPISKVKYIPIERIEWLLTRIFIQWSIEVKEVKLIANSVAVCVRLHYQDPISGNRFWQDGVGAQPLQTDKGAGANDWTKIKSASVQMALPAAESYAIKDAAEKIGKLFGKDMNRADQIAYGYIQKLNDTEGLNDDLIMSIENSETIEQLDNIYKSNVEKCPNRKGLINLIHKRKNTLNGTLS